MINCAVDVDLYFYGELDGAARARVEAHLRDCAACRQRLDDLHAIRQALADRPVVDAPPTGDWSGFMRRLESACAAAEPAARPAYSAAGSSAPSVDAAARPSGPRTAARAVAGVAAMLTIAALGVYLAMRARESAPAARPVVRVAAAARPAAAAADPLREATAEHLERSKLVVLGLTALDPRQTRAADWQYERQLAGTLLDDTRLYRQAAQQRGMADVARVMRDLETVLIETSMSDSTDREALARVQRLIAKRDLVMKMQLAATN